LAKKPYLVFAEQQNVELVAENKNNVLSVPRLVKRVKFFNENNFTQETDFFQ